MSLMLKFDTNLYRIFMGSVTSAPVAQTGTTAQPVSRMLATITQDIVLLQSMRVCQTIHFVRKYIMVSTVMVLFARANHIRTGLLVIVTSVQYAMILISVPIARPCQPIVTIAHIP